MFKIDPPTSSSYSYLRLEWYIGQTKRIEYNAGCILAFNNREPIAPLQSGEEFCCMKQDTIK